MDTKIESVISDSKALLELAKPAFEAQKKVASLEVANLELLSKVASYQNKEEKIKIAADKAAVFFDSRGMLKVSALDFSQRLQDNPEEIFSIVQKFADTFTLKEAGDGSDKMESLDQRDPIERFAFN